MLTFLYLSISVYLLATVALKFANFHYVSEIYESMDDYKIPVENPSSEELCQAWIDSLDQDYLEMEGIDNIDHMLVISKNSDNYLPF